MSDTCWGKIQIGGTLPKAKENTFKKLIKMSLAYLEPSAKVVFKNYMVGEPGFLEFEEPEVNYGNFEVEGDLRKLGLTYFKETGAGDEYGEAQEYWTPGMAKPKISYTQDGEECLAIYTVLGIIETIKRIRGNDSEIPLLLEDEDPINSFVAKYYTKHDISGDPMDCLSEYLKTHLVPSEIPPFVVQ